MLKEDLKRIVGIKNEIVVFLVVILIDCVYGENDGTHGCRFAAEFRRMRIFQTLSGKLV